MAVHRGHDNAVFRACRQNARHVAVGVDGHLQLACLSAFHVVAPGRHLRVVFAGLRIFVAVESGIVCIFAALRPHSLEHLQRVLLHVAPVEANPAEHLAVGREAEGAIEGKLLFIDPVGDAVDNLIELAVFRHLRFGIVVEQLHEENIPFAHEGHLRSVGVPQRSLLLAALGKAVEAAGLYIINVVVGLRRTAIDGLGIGLDEQSLAVGRGNVAIHLFDALAERLLSVEEHGGFGSGLERIPEDSLSVAGNGGILVGSGQRVHARDALRRKFSAHNGFDREFFSCKTQRCTEGKCDAYCCQFFHIVLMLICFNVQR